MPNICAEHYISSGGYLPHILAPKGMSSLHATLNKETAALNDFTMCRGRHADVEFILHMYVGLADVEIWWRPSVKGSRASSHLSSVQIRAAPFISLFLERFQCSSIIHFVLFFILFGQWSMMHFDLGLSSAYKC